MKQRSENINGGPPSGADEMAHNNMMDQGGGGMGFGDVSFDGRQHPDYGDAGKYGMYSYEYSFESQPFQPLYVNVKQLNWIKKRKARRDILDSLMISLKSNYLHESRHRHAMKRLRAPSGRFMTKEETEKFMRENGDL
jgi:hypothetical protein